MSLTISLFITIINLYQAFILTNNDYITLLKSFKGTKKDIFIKVILPSNKDNIISFLKINMSMNFIGVIMGELLVSKKGLGYLIMYGSQVFNITLVITSILILGILSFLITYLINYVEKKLSKR
jgi:NitT/TauT family transport system permease protein